MITSILTNRFKMQFWFQLLLLKSFLLQISTIVQQCPYDSIQFPNEDKCLFTDWANYYREAVDICESYGGIPAKLQNAFENSYVLKFATDFDNAYIGVERRGNSTWKYADGSNVTYFNWASNEPNKKNTSLCTVINPRSGKWYADDCTTGRPFFCTIDLYPSDASTTTQITPAETTKNPFCQAGWVYNQDTGYCYFLQNFTKADDFNYVLYNWTTAEKKCRSMGAHLVSIHTWDEDMFVNDLIASNVSKMPFFPDDYPCGYQCAWIGYYGTGAGETGNWTDKSKADYLDYQGPISKNDEQWMVEFMKLVKM